MGALILLFIDKLAQPDRFTYLFCFLFAAKQSVTIDARASRQVRVAGAKNYDRTMRKDYRLLPETNLARHHP